MAIYTSYEMIADCQQGKPTGWQHLVRHFLGPFRILNRHYGGTEDSLRRFLTSLGRMEGITPSPEREFVTLVRPALIAATGWRGGTATNLEFTAFEEALAELTMVERQLVWLDTLGYARAAAARLMRAAEDTAARAHEKAGALLRARLDEWTQNIVADNGESLARSVRQTPPASPLAFRDFIDLIDGRTIWQNRGGVERNILASWFEVDRFVIVREADQAMRDAGIVEDEEAAPYLELLGAPKRRPGLFGRIIGRK